MARLILAPRGNPFRAARHPDDLAAMPAPTPEPRGAQEEAAAPLSSGRFFRVTSAPEEALVTSDLARELTSVLEEFGERRGFTVEKPLDILFGRGVLGLHRFHRAADIYAVGGTSIAEWVSRWNAAMQRARSADTARGQQIVESEKDGNLGYRLYMALQMGARWAKPPGYPVQLFGPWTRTDGPHMAISDRLLYAHRDHIHVAR